MLLLRLFIFFSFIFWSVYASPRHDQEQPLATPVARIERSVRGKGFHVELLTRVHMYDSVPLQSCEVTLVQELPSNVYVDVDQLQNMKRESKILYDFKISSSSSVVDVEAAAYMSAAVPLSLQLTTTIPSHAASGTTDTAPAALNFDVPIHLRYHAPQSLSQPSSSLFAEIRIPLPQLIDVICSTQASSTSIHPTPAMMALVSDADRGIEPNGDVLIEVPVGNKDLLGLVTLVTCVVVVVGAVVLIRS